MKKSRSQSKSKFLKRKSEKHITIIVNTLNYNIKFFIVIVSKLSEPDYHRFRSKYPPVRTEPAYLALHPKEKTSNILDSILAGVAARSNKDIEGFMKLENDPIIQVHPSENQKAWDPNNLLESLGFDEGRKKLGTGPFMNSRRKKRNKD